MALRTDENLIRNVIKKRSENSHKGTFGALQFYCGSKHMTGAPFLAITGALHCGVGLVYVSAKRSLRKILQTRLSEPVFCKMKISKRATAFVVGCGSAKKAKRVKKLLKQTKPTVIDADAINYLSKHKKKLLKKKCDVILTPHEMEMSRLTGKDVAFISQNRELCAVQAAKEFDATVVLKGHETVIATPDGKVYINTTGNSGLAKGGSGDVLAGMTGAFLAQGYTPENAAVIAVWLHGKAADELAEEISMHGILPSMIPLQAAKILKRFE